MLFAPKMATESCFFLIPTDGGDAIFDFCNTSQTRMRFCCIKIGLSSPKPPKTKELYKTLGKPSENLAGAPILYKTYKNKHLANRT